MLIFLAANKLKLDLWLRLTLECVSVKEPQLHLNQSLSCASIPIPIPTVLVQHLWHQINTRLSQWSQLPSTLPRLWGRWISQYLWMQPHLGLSWAWPGDTDRVGEHDTMCCFASVISNSLWTWRFATSQSTTTASGATAQPAELVIDRINLLNARLYCLKIAKYPKVSERYKEN